MSKNDDSMLDDFMDGKSALSKVYQQGEKPQPPADLDAKILAQAQRAVGEDTSQVSRPGFGARRPRWLVPASLAATLMLGINLAYNLKDTTPDAPYTENTVVVVNEQFETKRQQARARRNQTADDSIRDAQPSVQPVQKMSPQPPVDTNVADQNEVSAPTSATETVVEPPSRFRAATTAPAMSPEPVMMNRILEETHRPAITGARRDRAEPDVTTEQKTAQDDIAYAPAPASIALNDEQTAPTAIESPGHSADTVAAPGREMPTTGKEPSQSRSAIAGFAVSTEENKHAQDADNPEQYAESTESSLSSTATAAAPSKNSQSEAQNRGFYRDTDSNTQSYLCDLAALGISETDIAEKTLTLLARQSPPSESTFENLIVDSARRGDYQQACLELAAFQKRYPNATLPADFPVRLSD